MVDPACPASALVSNYGVSLPQHEVALPLRELIRVRLGRALVVGDRLSLGGLVLTVRDIDERGTVTQIGLKCPVLTRPPR